jgi:hypothetical protein
MVGTFHTNKPLTNISVAWSNQQSMLLVDKLFPRVNVVREADKYLVYDSNFRVTEDARADGAPSNQISFGATSATFQVEEYALHDVVTDRQRGNVDAPLDLERSTTENLTEMVMLGKESRAVDLMFTTTSWTNNTTLTATWNDNTADVADPLTAIDTAAIAVIKGCARMPNKVVMGRDVLTYLKNNYKIIERIKYAERALVTADLIAAMCDVPEVLIGTSLLDTTNEVTATSAGFAWTDDFWMGYIAPSPGLKTPSATYQFSTHGLQVKKWRDEDVNGDKIEVSDAYQLAIPATGAGYLIKDCNASG